MANIIELFALVETVDLPAGFSEGGALRFPTAIKRIVRTYESKNRAEQDMELISEVSTGACFDVITIPHIES